LLKVAEPAKIPVFGCCIAGAVAYNHHYFFSQPNDRPSMEAAVSKIAADGHKTFVHFYLNNPWGIGNIELVNEFASKKGLRVLSNTAVEPESTDLTVLVTRVMATKPDAVLSNVPGKGSAVLARAFEAVGWHPPNYQNGLFPTIAVKILGGWELFEGVKMFRQYDARNPLCSQVFDKYQKRYGVFKEDLNILGGWDAAQAAIEAIRAAKDPKSGESIREAAERLVDVPAATGRAGTRIKYAPDRHYILGADSFTWVQIKGGKPEYVD
jgi:ABC-type branched-subunit amino acid transport system substrate-binding protein